MLSRPNKGIDDVWEEFQGMEQGKDYTWENPWSPEINPFRNFDYALKYASCRRDFRAKECNDGSTVVMSEWGSDLYFFYRIRELSSKEIITIVKLYENLKDDLESLKGPLKNLAEKINKIKN